MRFAARRRGALVSQSQHAVLDKAARPVAYGGAIDAGFVASFTDTFGEEHNWSDGFVVMLAGIREEQLDLLEVIPAVLVGSVVSHSAQGAVSAPNSAKSMV